MKTQQSYLQPRVHQQPVEQVPKIIPQQRVPQQQVERVEEDPAPMKQDGVLQNPAMKTSSVTLSPPSDYQLFVYDFARQHKHTYTNLGMMARDVSGAWAELPAKDRQNWASWAKELRQIWPDTRYKWTREGSIYIYTP